MSMTVVCAWCGKVLQEGLPEEEVSHGICPQCSDFFVHSDVQSLQDFLDKLIPPVLVVDGNVTILGANRSALGALRKNLPEIKGCLGGNVVECAYARLPGGCGKTVHCEACTIRLTVSATYRDGQPRDRVEGFQEIEGPEGLMRVHIFVTTRKSGDVVLLRIDDT